MRLKRVALVSLLLASIWCSNLFAEEICQSTEKLLLRHFSNEEEQQRLLLEFKSQLNKFETLSIANSYCEELQRNLKEKLLNEDNPLRLTSNDVIRHAILYESFRIETYLSAGVAPKRYFGFFDEKGDTAKFERELRSTIIHAVRITNEFANDSQLKTRVNEKEIALTFLPEGGALLLTNPEDSPNRVHPVRGVGLDDYRMGFAHFQGLVERYDSFFGTKLGNLIVPFIAKSLLLRPMTFRESILGTTLMYLYEKEITARVMQRDWGSELMALSPRQQFICTSLVYNSGILFSKERVQQIEQFITGEYLDVLNKNTKRPKLAVTSPDKSLEQLKKGLPIPKQLTSWSAVYHILQRYGAWTALEQFSDIFKDEAFTNRA